jgi:hypothetical protein
MILKHPKKETVCHVFPSGDRDSSVSIVTGYGLDGWHSIPSRGKIFLFSTASRLALGPTQSPIKWVLRNFSLEVKWPWHEAITRLHLVPRSKMVEVHSTSQYVMA